MGWFSNNALIDIIDWEPSDDNVIVHKYDRHDNEIKSGAKLIVRESQLAVIVEKGQFSDVFSAGTHELSTENMPILSDLMGWKHGFDSPFITEVYFIDAKYISGMGWGTPNEIPLRDADFGIVRLSAFGEYQVKVTDPKKFLSEVSGTDKEFTKEELDEKLMPFVVSKFADVLGESKIPALDLAMKYEEIGAVCETGISERLATMGLTLKNFMVMNIALPDNVEKAMDQRASMGAIGNMGQFNQFQMGNAIGEVAANPGEGGAMSDGMSTGMEMGMAMNMMNQMSNPQQQQQQATTPPPTGGATPPPMGGPAIALHISLNGQQYGPYDIDQLKQYVTEGRITGETQCWKEGMAGWAEIKTVPELATLFGPPAGSPPPPPM